MNEKKASYYKCLICDYSFVMKSSLNSHMKASHENATNYVCSVCDYRFPYMLTRNHTIATFVITVVLKKPVEKYMSNQFMKIGSHTNAQFVTTLVLEKPI